MSVKRLCDINSFKSILNSSKNILVLTGAGVSAESGIPVFRGPGGFWNNHNAMELATVNAFQRSPSLVWGFYNFRRKIAFNAKPNKAHVALAKLEKEFEESPGRKMTLITQNVDGLHVRAGSKNIIQLHGALDQVKCTNPNCRVITLNMNVPITPAFSNDEMSNEELAGIQFSELPKCQLCNSLVRPHILWFGESYNHNVLARCGDLAEQCDLCILVGTSMTVYPANQFALTVADSGRTVAEFNLNPEASKDNFKFFFSGPCGITLPHALGYDNL